MFMSTLSGACPARLHQPFFPYKGNHRHTPTRAELADCVTPTLVHGLPSAGMETTCCTVHTVHTVYTCCHALRSLSSGMMRTCPIMDPAPGLAVEQITSSPLQLQNTAIIFKLAQIQQADIRIEKGDGDEGDKLGRSPCKISFQCSRCSSGPLPQ